LRVGQGQKSEQRTDICVNGAFREAFASVGVLGSCPLREIIAAFTQGTGIGYQIGDLEITQAGASVSFGPAYKNPKGCFIAGNGWAGMVSLLLAGALIKIVVIVVAINSGTRQACQPDRASFGDWCLWG
jgi:hypothetical protein